MPTIVTKRVLNPTVTLMEVDCPAIARKAKPGQFVMVRSDPMGERIPLTIADYDAVRGTVTIMYQRVGLTTQKLDQLNSGDDILDMVGPLGNPTEVDGVRDVVNNQNGMLMPPDITAEQLRTVLEGLCRISKEPGGRPCGCHRGLPHQGAGVPGGQLPQELHQPVHHHRRRHLRGEGLRVQQAG